MGAEHTGKTRPSTTHRPESPATPASRNKSCSVPTAPYIITGGLRWARLFLGREDGRGRLRPIVLEFPHPADAKDEGNDAIAAMAWKSWWNAVTSSTG